MLFLAGAEYILVACSRRGSWFPPTRLGLLVVVVFIVVGTRAFQISFALSRHNMLGRGGPGRTAARDSGTTLSCFYFLAPNVNNNNW